jgi:protein-S-isoprenylcysteine O-methyltransferase Ste14
MPLWAIGFVLAIREGESLLYNDTLLTTIIGWGLIFSGGIIIISALYTIRGKAAAQSAGDALVYKGLYSIVRHPVYSGTFLEFAGLLILWPSFTVGIAFITGTLWIAVQSKLEELDLQKRIEGYSDYMKITPPFFPYRLFMKGN